MGDSVNTTHKHARLFDSASDCESTRLSMFLIPGTGAGMRRYDVDVRHATDIRLGHEARRRSGGARFEREEGDWNKDRRAWQAK